MRKQVSHSGEDRVLVRRRPLWLGHLVVALVSAFACAPVSERATDSATFGAATPSPASTTQPTPTETASPRSDLPAPPDTASRTRVLRVVDGDTVVLARLGVGSVDNQTGGNRARLIGIDTPEVHGRTECYGAEASAFAKRELDGEHVLVDLDVQATDRYGRALVYIWTLDGAFFNGRLVSEGYALQATFPPNVRYAELFTRLAREAREAGRGLWSACDDPSPTPAHQARTDAEGSRSGVAPATEWDCPSNHPVKGNRGSSGWIHHTPGSTYYDRTKPEECFRDGSDAEAAGYRAPRR